MRWLVPLFVVVPLVDLYLLLQVATWIDFWPTVGLVVGTGLAGGLLAKREIRRVWRGWQQALARMTVPEEGVVNGLLVLVGGALLVTPGVLTDLAGLLLLIPPSRRALAHHLERYLRRRFEGAVHVVPPGAAPRSRAAPGWEAGRVVETVGESVPPRDSP